MTEDQLALWVQVAAVVVALAAAIVALVVSAADRRNARSIAEADRREALEQGKLIFEMELLTRLLENARRGGSQDPEIRAQLGAEAGALIGAIGPNRLPLSWEDRIGKDEAGLRSFVADEANQLWLRKSVETQLALMGVTAEIESRLRPSSGRKRKHP
jgi:hypothetical protein